MEPHTARDHAVLASFLMDQEFQTKDKCGNFTAWIIWGVVMGGVGVYALLSDSDASAWNILLVAVAIAISLSGLVLRINTGVELRRIKKLEKYHRRKAEIAEDPFIY